MQAIRDERRPLYLQVRDYLRSLVDSGEFKPGDQLRSEYDLAAELGVSRNTVREALLSLEQDNLVVRRHGVGTFVAPKLQDVQDHMLQDLTSILQLTRLPGARVEFAEMEIGRQKAPEDIAYRLAVDRGTLLTTVSRVIRVNGKPAAYTVAAVPSSVLAPSDLNGKSKGCVFEVLRRRPELHVAHALTEIVATAAGACLAEKLGVREHQPLLVLEQRLYNTQGAVLAFSREHCVPDCFRFQLMRR